MPLKAEHEQTLRDVVALGFTALCLDVPVEVVSAVSARVGSGGLAIACPPVTSPDAAPVVSLRCSPRALPLLSHSIDVAIAGPAIAEDDAALVELRRVLAPGGTLALLLDPGRGAPASDLRPVLTGLGFTVTDAGTTHATIACAPPWTGAAGRRRA